jgi:hypothetical protein
MVLDKDKKVNGISAGKWKIAPEYPIIVSEKLILW